MASTLILLKENFPGLGAEADVVNVRKDFARSITVKSYDAEDFVRKIRKLKLETR